MEIYLYHSHIEQLKALRVLIFKWQNLILVIKTSFNKSIIIQVLLYLIPNAVIIIILLFNTIGLKQIKKITKLLYVRPIHI